MGILTSSKSRLAGEVDRLRERISRLEAAAADHGRAEKALRHLFDSSLVGIIFADVYGNVTEANDSFLDIAGYERSDLPLRWDLMTPPEWRDSDQLKIDELTATGVGTPFEKEFTRKDGSRVPVLIGGTLLYGSEEDCVAIVLDLSESKEAEVALRESEERYRALYENIPLMYFTLDADG